MQNVLKQTKNMTPGQRARYLKANMSAPPDPVSRMVDQGIISRAQADAVRGTMKDGGQVFSFCTAAPPPVFWGR